MTALVATTAASVLCLIAVSLLAGAVEVRARGTALAPAAGWLADLALWLGCVLVLVWLLVAFGGQVLGVGERP